MLGLFDFNNDGKMNTFEKASELAIFASIMDEEERREKMEDAGLDPDDDDDIEEFEDEDF